jgi:uncharacterized membrane protein
MRLRPWVHSGESGNIMLLGIGLLGVCLLALAVIADSSSAFIQQRNLQAQADSLALAGVQGIDLIAYYNNGATDSTKLNAGNVNAIVQGHFLSTGSLAQETLERPVLQLQSTETGVYVTLTTPLRLTFFDSLPFDPIRVSAAARLDYRSFSG